MLNKVSFAMSYSGSTKFGFGGVWNIDVIKVEADNLREDIHAYLPETIFRIEDTLLVYTRPRINNLSQNITPSRCVNRFYLASSDAKTMKLYAGMFQYDVRPIVTNFNPNEPIVHGHKQNTFHSIEILQSLEFEAGKCYDISVENDDKDLVAKFNLRDKS